LDVKAHEKEDAPHYSLLNWIGSWFFLPDHLNGLWCEIVETPAGLIDGDPQWPIMLIEEVGRVFGD
jgi:hypothetical protein